MPQQKNIRLVAANAKIAPSKTSKSDLFAF
jgi:hypothetical protein